MPTREFFNPAPTEDKTFGTVGKWCSPPGHFRNGCFQHIIWLGVSGYLIINHFEPKEILLVDPWPSYRRTPLFRRVRSSRRRLAYLAGWLRNRAAEGYRVSGILASHAHFDHTADIPAILELLSLPKNKTRRTKNIRHSFYFDSEPISEDRLPRIYCDADSVTAIRDENAANPSLLSFHEIKNGDQPLNYDGSHPDPPAGTMLQAIPVGGFQVTPIVWDHMNLCVSEANVFGAAGAAQRQTAFLVCHAGASGAKKTLIVGSAGEMSDRFANGVTHLDEKLLVDTLIQSVTLPAAPNTNRQLADLVHYQTTNIEVRDYIIASHWESFVFGPVRKGRRFRKQYKRVEKYKKALGRIDPLAANKVIALRRLKFELGAIPNPTTMVW